MTNYELLQLSEKLSKDQYVGVLVHNNTTGTQRVLRIQGITRHPPERGAKEDMSNWLVSFSVSEDDSQIPPNQVGDDATPGYLAKLQTTATDAAVTEPESAETPPELPLTTTATVVPEVIAATEETSAPVVSQNASRNRRRN